MEQFAPLEATLQAPAKINLSLYVDQPRADGYHPLSSIMVPLTLCDILAANYEPADCQLTCHCLVNGAEQLARQPNLVTQLAINFGQARDIRGHLIVSLKKNIPLKAGLGGGSSDGAAILNWLNNLCENPWDLTELGRWAAQYSADTPFFLYNQAALVSGIGEIVSPLTQIEDSFVLLAKPPATYSTQQIYKQFDLLKQHKHTMPATLSAHRYGQNDLLVPAKKYCPAIQTALDDLQLALAKSYQPYTTVALSGSGSTCYALLKSDEAGAKQALNALERRPNWFYALTKIAPNGL